MEEKNILKSADNTILLTTHRLIETTQTNSREVFLKDLTSYEIKYKKQTYYIVLSGIFLIGLLGFAIAVAQEVEFTRNLGPSEISGGYGILSVLTAISLYFTFFSVIPTLVISGKHNSFELNVDGFKKENLRKFMDELKRQSDGRKRDEIN